MNHLQKKNHIKSILSGSQISSGNWNLQKPEKKRFTTQSILLGILISISLYSCNPGSREQQDTDNGFTFYSRSAEQFQAKNYHDALAYINEAIKINDRIAVYHELKGDIYYRLDSLNQALKAYASAKSKRSYYPEIYLRTGDIYYKKNDYNSAIRDYRKAIAQSPDEPDLLLKLILCYIQQYEYDVAANLLQEYNTDVTKLNKPVQPEYYVLLGKIQFEKANYQDVVKSIDKTRQIRKLTRNECLFYLRALIEVNKLEEAYSLATKEYKDILVESDVHYIRGLYYYSQQNFQDAEIQLEQSIQKKTKIHEAYILLADIYSQKGQEQLAEQSIQNAEKYKSYRLINIGHKY